jgi:1,4-dihydroxy-2-naphthoate octaprenyltransferase
MNKLLLSKFGFSLPLAWPLLQRVRGEKGYVLNQALAGTARLELIYGLLFSAGLIIGRWV